MEKQLYELPLPELEEALAKAWAREVTDYQKFACACSVTKSGTYVKEFTAACAEIQRIEDEIWKRKHPELKCGRGDLPNLVATQHRYAMVRKKLLEKANGDPNSPLNKVHREAAKLPLSFFRIRSVDEAVTDLIKIVLGEEAAV